MLERTARQRWQYPVSTGGWIAATTIPEFINRITEIKDEG